MQNYNSKFKTNLRERCYKFSLEIIKLADPLSNKQSAKIIMNQLIRSATSVGSNIIEARASSSRREFKRYNEISLKSANETKYWLALLRDGRLINEETANNLLREVIEISNMLASGILRLRNKNF